MLGCPGCLQLSSHAIPAPLISVFYLSVGPAQPWMLLEAGEGLKMEQQDPSQPAKWPEPNLPSHLTASSPSLA